MRLVDLPSATIQLDQLSAQSISIRFTPMQLGFLSAGKFEHFPGLFLIEARPPQIQPFRDGSSYIKGLMKLSTLRQVSISPLAIALLATLGLRAQQVRDPGDG
jgi:hypothetical protein